MKNTYVYKYTHIYVYVCAYTYIFLSLTKYSHIAMATTPVPENGFVNKVEEPLLPFSCLGQRDIRMISDSHNSSFNLRASKILTGFLSVPTH